MDQTHPLIDIIVCNYNEKFLTAKCLDSVLKSDYTDYNIVLVDDCSTDDSVDFFSKYYPGIKIIKNRNNLGAALARNAGIANGHAKYVVTMDNDATLSPFWLGQMVRLMETEPQIGQAVGKILRADDPQLIAAAGGSLMFRGRGYDIGSGAPVDELRYNQRRQVLYACSASMIIRRAVLNKVGGFYGGYYHGYEDTDLSLRINLAGHQVVYLPAAVSYHRLSATVVNTIKRQKNTYLFMRNRLLLMFRNYEDASLRKYLPQNLRFNLRLCWEHPENILPFIKSVISVVCNFFNILEARKEMNAIRQVSDRDLASLFNLE